MREGGVVGGWVFDVTAGLDVWTDEVEAFEAVQTVEEVALFVGDFVEAHHFNRGGDFAICLSVSSVHEFGATVVAKSTCAVQKCDFFECVSVQNWLALAIGGMIRV